MTNPNITKKLLYSFATASLFFAGACSSDDEAVLKETTKIEIKDFSLSVAEGDSTLNFFAAANWRATLSSTSWITIDPMTKAGAKGESKIILNWNAHTGITARTADLTIAVEGENPVVIRISQLPNEPIVVVSKSESILKVDAKALNGRGLFCDTITVESNVKWSVKEQPSWLEYEELGSIKPQDGVPTSIQVVLKGKHADFNAAEMAGNFVVGRSSEATLDNAIAVKAVSELSVVTEAGEALNKVMIVVSPENEGRFQGNMIVESNTAWSITNLPSWIISTSTDNAIEYAKSLVTRKTVTFELKESDLSMDLLAQTILIKDAKTGVQSEVELVFEGVAEDYFESKLSFERDFMFDASAYTPTWDPIEGAVLSKEFDMVSAKDYATLEEAPFEFFFIHKDDVSTYKQQVYWAGVEMASVQAHALHTKRLSLYVNDRNMDMMDENKSEIRSAFMVTAPKGTLFEDLFEEGSEEPTEDPWLVKAKLKEEYELSSSLIVQKPMAKEMPELDIPAEVTFGAEGGKQTFGVRNFSMVSFKIDGRDAGAPGHWITISLDDIEYTTEVYLVAEPNKTGEARTSKIEAILYDMATDTEEIIYSFTVSQD